MFYSFQFQRKSAEDEIPGANSSSSVRSILMIHTCTNKTFAVVTTNCPMHRLLVYHPRKEAEVVATAAVVKLLTTSPAWTEPMIWKTSARIFPNKHTIKKIQFKMRATFVDSP